MSNAAMRTALAEAVTTVEGVTGYARRPKVVKAGDAWPLWRGGERDGGFAFAHTWAVLIVLPGDETSADVWVDEHGDEVTDALRPLLYVESIAPAVVTASSNDMYALMITGRSE